MNPDTLRQLLEKVKTGVVEIDEALNELKLLPYERIGFATLDHHRYLRRGFPEVVLCRGKTTEQVVEIIDHLWPAARTVLATKAEPEVFTALQKVTDEAHYHPLSKLIVVGGYLPVVSQEIILVATAGTADIAIAEEAAITAEAMGNRVERLYDVGVAGLHRLLDSSKTLLQANVIIAVAGMEGALPSIISGMVEKPVIAVPTSTGYGASFQGLAALLGMLNTCSPGVAVVNIDNGFGAGYIASLINQQTRKSP
ncbi:MAG: nickel pincer cofactor biosynthesis protein LarB [Chloroflexi bacterium]|nr:nickel pincer cofactor biosynthesis protein LarB [Chloroflexota bacterium]